MAGPMAELWQAARKQVAGYEQRSAELSLALATERSSLEAVQREVKQLDEGERRRGAGPPPGSARSLSGPSQSHFHPRLQSAPP